LLKVVTNSAATIPLLLSSENVNLILLGGVLNRNSAAFYDGDIKALATTSGFKNFKAFLSLVNCRIYRIPVT
jgi:DeoR/GlpR family transcriptional regulator of sugar metabolism